MDNDKTGIRELIYLTRLKQVPLYEVTLPAKRIIKHPELPECGQGCACLPWEECDCACHPKRLVPKLDQP